MKYFILCLSYINFELVDKAFDEKLFLINKCFQYNQKESKVLRKTYFSNSEITYDDSDRLFSLKKITLLLNL